MKRAAISAGVLSALLLAASGEDWPQWGGHPSRNMYSTDKGLPDRFEPGKLKKGTEEVDLATTKIGVPVLWWRVVGSSHTTFAVEAFIDEAAHAAGQDPYAFRRKLLEHEPRMKAVLDLAADKAGWKNGPLPAGKGRGIADCGQLTNWAWTGKAFVLISENTMPACHGVSSDDWPPLFASRQK